MLAARVEPKNGIWKRMKKRRGQICKAIALASLLPHVTTDHLCALSRSTRFSAGGFVLVSVKAKEPEKRSNMTVLLALRRVAAMVSAPINAHLKPLRTNWGPNSTPLVADLTMQDRRGHAENRSGSMRV